MTQDDWSFGERALYLVEQGKQFGLTNEEIVSRLNHQHEAAVCDVLELAMRGVSKAVQDVTQKITSAAHDAEKTAREQWKS